ncbi:D-glucuronyl C5-epimerase family protein [Phnomibacter sp. MR]|uniref:D-glucuronyl C5-epimerase family protein n=1 Tax=Phnomibacter sp. MR TaxID=3042318 RepID=UPI003A80524C
MKRIIRYILVLPLALLATYWLAGKYGDSLEEPVRKLLFAAKGDSIPNYAPEFVDEKGIPYVVYATENGITPGKQYNATIVANYALEYANQYEATKDAAVKKSFMHCVQWLIANATVQGDTALYMYPWRQAWYPAIPAPYTSGMTSGMVLQVLLKAQQLQPDTSYATLGRQLVNGCFRTIDSGGFTIQEPQGWWYEELAAPGVVTPRILDGHIFTIIGLLQYRNAKQDTMAAIAAEMGLQSLRYFLPFYDAGNGNMYYDHLHKPADRKYKKVITGQMQTLFELTGDSIYLQYQQRWTAPMKRHYVHRMYAERNKTGWVLFLGLLAVVWLVLYLFLKRLVRTKLKRRKQ